MKKGKKKIFLASHQSLNYRLPLNCGCLQSESAQALAIQRG
jgi:hypothetical protein